MTAALHTSFVFSTNFRILRHASGVSGEGPRPKSAHIQSPSSLTSCTPHRSLACLTLTSPSPDDPSPGTADLDVQAVLYSDVSEASVEVILSGTVLAGKRLVRPYSAAEDGFDHRAFFDCTNLVLGGIPCLLVGRAMSGCLFGGYNPVGFEGRDDPPVRGQTRR
jgi:hypothetical protein